MKISQFRINFYQQIFHSIEHVTELCHPNPCGLNSQCRVVNQHEVCSCLPGYISSPPNCRPECLVSSDCAPNRACINKKCVDPCIGVCGLQARCNVINHNAICSCAPGYTGEPTIRCIVVQRKCMTLSANLYSRK